LEKLINAWLSGGVERPQRMATVKRKHTNPTRVNRIIKRARSISAPARAEAGAGSE